MKSNANTIVPRFMAASILVAVLLTVGMTANSADYDLSWYKVAGGGETVSEGGAFQLGGTIGQHDAGVLSGGEYTLAGGFWAGGTVMVDLCPIPADLNCDGVVDALDLLILLGAWGKCADPNDCPADLNGDGEVNALDLLILLGSWG